MIHHYGIEFKGLFYDSPLLEPLREMDSPDKAMHGKWMVKFDPDYPFILNTGRLLYHWHGGTLTRRVEGLLELAPRLEVAMHPADARRLAIGHGAAIRVTSRRGELAAFAHITEAVQPGSVFVPFVRLADSAANVLTNAALDPVSKIPEYKVCAVAIEPAGSP